MDSENVHDRVRTFLHSTWRSWPSRHASTAAVFARTIPIVFLPLMIGTLIAVLESQPILRTLLWIFPLALAGSALWTRAWLHSNIAAVLVRTDAVAALTFSEIGRGVQPEWKRLTDIYVDRDVLSATIGREPYQFRSREWGDLARMASALELALDAYRNRPEGRSARDNGRS